MTLLSITPAAATAAAADAGVGEAGVPAPDGGAASSDASAAGDGGASADSAAPPATAQAVLSLPDLARVTPPVEAAPRQLEELTVVGTRESRTPGSAQVLRPRDLERMDYDNPEMVTKTLPGVYARGEDGFGLRPNIGIRGTSPDRSKKVTLMEDGLLFAPAPYSAPAAYYFPLITRMELVRVIKGPGAVSFGPQTIGGAIDLVTRSIPADEAGAIDLAAGQYGYGKLHGWFGASTARAGYVIEGVHLRSTGYKEIDTVGGDTGFEKNEWMWKGRYLLSTDPNAAQSVGLKLGYADEDSRESYLGLSDVDFRANPYRRYVSSSLDRMMWHRTQVAATYQGRFRDAFTVDAAVYRNDFFRIWRKFNRIGPAGAVSRVLAYPYDENAVIYSVLKGESPTSTTPAGEMEQTIYIGPNRREFVSQGVQLVGGWQGRSGPVEHIVQAGVRYHYDRIDRLHTEEGFLIRDGNLVPVVPGANPLLVTANGRAWANALALHLTDAASWGRLTVTPGVRVELIETRARDRISGLEATGESQRVVIPGLGVYGALTPSLGLLAGVYRGFSPAAAPQFEQVMNGPTRVSTLARPELAVNYEAGVRFTPPRLRLEAIGFFNDYQNLTSDCTVASCGPDLVGMQSNAGKAHIYGAEFFARADTMLAPGYTIPIIAAYTYTRTELLENFDSPDPTLGRVVAGYELPYVPRHQVAATAAFETPVASLAVAGAYVSAMREHAGQGPPPPLEPFTDPSFILDVTARVPVRAARQIGQIYVSVRNLLGAEDIVARLPFGARPVAPRWVQVGTKWSF
jgi:Fe(3+) dicitrate transport protein